MRRDSAFLQHSRGKRVEEGICLAFTIGPIKSCWYWDWNKTCS